MAVHYEKFNEERAEEVIKSLFRNKNKN